MESIDSNLVFLWRAVERFANVLIGALAIYLGYKLFMNLPERREAKKGEMKLMLPGDISVYVSRVGPGVFFALFGTAVVLMSFVSTLQIDTQKGSTNMITSSESPRTSEAPPKPGTLVSLSYVSGEGVLEGFLMQGRRLVYDWRWGNATGRGFLEASSSGGLTGSWGYKEATQGGGTWDLCTAGSQ